MSRVRLSRRAEADIHEMWEYIAIAGASPVAAQKQLDRLYDRLTLLAAQPLLGELRDDLRPGLRTFSAGSYIVFYYPIEDGIEVASVVHGARDIESLFHTGER